MGSDRFKNQSKLKMPIYLDYMATTPLCSEVKSVMCSFLEDEASFGNPSSKHHFGQLAFDKIIHAREQVASLISASPKEIIFTSGATESDNLAIKGAAHFYQSKGKHLITCKTEHKAVLDSFLSLEKEGFTVTYLTPYKSGLVSVKDVASAIQTDTILMSLMHVNNEIGVVQDIKEIGNLLKSKGILFHVDAAQSVGKIPIDLSDLSVDMMSFSAHKIYGPKGIGVLYIKQKPKVRLTPLIEGGGQELGYRSGTYATHQIIGMGEAFSQAKKRLDSDMAHIAFLSQKLLKDISHIPGMTLNGHPTKRYQGTLSLTFPYIEGSSLLFGLRDLAISTASACTKADMETSHVLNALGLSQSHAHSTVRLSIGRQTTVDEIDFAIDTINQVANRLHRLSPHIKEDSVSSSIATPSVKEENQLLAYFEDESHVGQLDENSPRVISATVGNSTQEDCSVAYLKGDASLSLIEEMRFQAFAGPKTIALLAYVCELLEGQALERLNAIDYKDLIKHFDLSDEYIHCAISVETLLSRLYNKVKMQQKLKNEKVI